MEKSKRTIKYWADHIMNNFTIMEAHKFTWCSNFYNICSCVILERECKNCEKREGKFDKKYDLHFYCRASREFLDDFHEIPEYIDGYSVENPMKARLSIIQLNHMLRDMISMKIKEILKS